MTDEYWTRFYNAIWMWDILVTSQLTSNAQGSQKNLLG